MIKVINTGLQGFKIPEIMKMSSFEVLNSEIGILLYQSEAEKSIKPLNLVSNDIIIYLAQTSP